VILDKLDKTILAYSRVCNKFGLLTRSRDASHANDDDHHTLEEKENEKLLKTYHHDTEPPVKYEWLQFMENEASVL
jgi:hypothetical protein